LISSMRLPESSTESAVTPMLFPSGRDRLVMRTARAGNYARVVYARDNEAQCRP
jgi:hypothetical protein